MKSIRRLLVVLGFFSTTLSLPVHAGFSWTFDSNPVQGLCQSAFVGNECTQSDTVGLTTIGVTATAWASSALDDTSANFEQATLKRWDGLAVNSVGELTSQPEHATDNNGKLEGVLFSYDNTVELTSITMGWHEDADFSLLAYTGVGAPANLTNDSYDTLISSGWSLVSNNLYSSYTNNGTDITASDSASDDYARNLLSGGVDENHTSFNGANVSSSYWLVAGLNGAFFSKANYIGNDYFKIKTLTANISNVPPQIPVPATSMLMALVFAAFGFAQRKKTV